MANEKRLRVNSVGGLIEDNPLLVAGTTLTSAALAVVPLVDSTSHFPIVLDPDGIEGTPEIAWITAHTAGASTATILRAQEGTGAIQHSQGIPWVHAPTVDDFKLPYLTAAITSDVSMPVVQTFYDGPTLSLYAATWMVSGQLDYAGQTDWFFAKLWDGTNVFGSGAAYSPTPGGGITIPITPAIIVLAATTTIKLSGAVYSNAGGGVIKGTMNLLTTGTNGKVSRMTAVRIA